MHRNSMRKGLTLKYVPVQRHRLTFHKLIRVIRIFMLKIFVVKCHPRNIFNIELFPNYSSIFLWKNVLCPAVISCSDVSIPLFHLTVQLDMPLDVEPYIFYLVAN